MSKTSIEWTEETWNPVTGCNKISPGCKHCYAEVMAARLKAMGQQNYRNGFEVTLQPHMLTILLKRRKPTMYFVNSMSDLFHDDIPFEYVAAVFGVMAACPQHTFQVLTKRPVRMREFFAWVDKREADGRAMFPDDVPEWRIWHMLHVSALRIGAAPTAHHGGPWPLPNVWLGVSVEDRKYGLPRIAELRATPAAVRFLSVEPLLEDLGTLDLAGIDWVIVGGESGVGARPMHPEWVRNIRDQVLVLRDVCRPCDGKGQWYYDINGEMGACPRCHGRGFLGPALFFKQWGEWGQAPWKLQREPGETDDAYKARSEELCATHSYATWASAYGWQPHEAGHRPWSIERCATLSPAEQAPMRKWGKTKAGRELDGRTWDEMPRRGT